MRTQAFVRNNSPRPRRRRTRRGQNTRHDLQPEPAARAPAAARPPAGADEDQLTITLDNATFSEFVNSLQQYLRDYVVQACTSAGVDAETARTICANLHVTEEQIARMF